MVSGSVRDRGVIPALFSSQGSGTAQISEDRRGGAAAGPSEPHKFSLFVPFFFSLTSGHGDLLMRRDQLAWLKPRH